MRGMPSLPAPSTSVDASFAWTARDPVCERTLAPAEPDVREIADWVLDRLYRGPGYALLRGLPFDVWGVDRSREVCWSIACALGEPVSQTAQGARVVDVRDTSREEATPRQFKTSQELRLHTDPAS